MEARKLRKSMTALAVVIASAAPVVVYSTPRPPLSCSGFLFSAGMCLARVLDLFSMGPDQ